MSAKTTASEVACHFLRKVDSSKGDALTPLKLQKLVYYAQAWYYTLFNTPLFDDKIEAWAHGPVVRSVWNTYKQFASKDAPIEVSKAVLLCDPIEDERVIKLLDDVKSIYGEHSGAYLEELSHSELPWRLARQGLKP